MSALTQEENQESMKEGKHEKELEIHSRRSGTLSMILFVFSCFRAFVILFR